MAYSSRVPVRSYRPSTGARATGPRLYSRPYYRTPVAPPSVGAATASNSLATALGAVGATLGCLLCLAAIGALGLFSTVVALTAYTKQFVDKYKQVAGLSDDDSGVAQVQVGVFLMVLSLIYTFVCQIQRH